MSEIRRNYELAFHINPNLEESRITQIFNELRDQLTGNGNMVTFGQEPERRRLSYEIDHHGTAFFGYIHFNTENPEGLAAVEEYIKLNPDILRSLIVRLPSDAKKNRAMLRQAKARARIEKAKVMQPPVRTPAVPNEKLDEELEEIIEKL